MKKILFAIIVLSFCLSGIPNLYASDRTTKKYDYKDFTGIEAGNGVILKVDQSSSFDIEINAEKKDFEYLKVEKKGQTLRIYLDKNNYRKEGDIRVSIHMPSLEALDLSGGSQCQLSMINKENCSCDLSGGAELKGNLECDDINIEISGGSVIKIAGKANNLTADGSGGSIFYLRDFSVKDVNADLSGGARLEIKMDGTLNVDASGGSNVVYFGTAKIGSTDFSGGSGISQGN